MCDLPSPGHEGFKTRHVEIDADGCGIVSEGVWDGLCHLMIVAASSLRTR